MVSSKLLVKNLPEQFTDVDKTDFLKLFGGSEVIALSDYGKMRNCCYVSFPDVVTAKQALETLHQFEVLDKKLVVEFAKSIHEKIANQTLSKNILEKKVIAVNEEDGEKEKHIKEELITGICPKLNVNHPFPSHLTYKYPEPNVTTLTNIANAMATVPKFYTQVLHLMNKMNLPAPFAGPTLTPPLAGDSPLRHDVGTDTSDLVEYESSEESELDSDSDTKKPEIYLKNQVVEPVRKRKRLKALNKVNQEKFRIVPLKKAESVESAFEINLPTNKVDFSLANRIKEAVERKVQPPVHFSVFDERGDFGRIEPQKKDDVTNTIVTNTNVVSTNTNFITNTVADMEEDSDEEEEEDDSDEENTDYIKLNQLQENRISQSEILAMTQFKNYKTGDRTNRLYIKNLSKQVKEDDLKFIFCRFVRKCSDADKQCLDIRLMQEGRMKGQAFITFPTEAIAEDALNNVHGYVLHDKPMVIQYGRAGK